MMMALNNRLLSIGLALMLIVCTSVSRAQEQQEAPRSAGTNPSQLESKGATSDERPLMQVLSKEMNHPVLKNRDSRYVLRPGDVLEVNFPLAPTFNQLESIQPDGYISLQNIGELKAAGMTVPELIDGLKEKYSKIMRDPQITVILKEFEHPYFVASGELAKPGKYDIRGETTVSQAIAIAGGFNNVAKKSQVLLFRRVSDDYLNVKQLDLKKMFAEGNLQEDVELQPGDLLFVPKSGVATFINTILPHTSMGIYYPIGN